MEYPWHRWRGTPDRTRQRRRPGCWPRQRSYSSCRSGHRPLPSRATRRRSRSSARPSSPRRDRSGRSPSSAIRCSSGRATSPRCRRCLRARLGADHLSRGSGVHGGQLPTGRERGIGRELDHVVAAGGMGPAERRREPRQQRRRILWTRRELQRQHDPVSARRDRARPHRVVEHDHPDSGARRRAGRVQPGPRNRRCRAPVAPPVGLAGGRRRQRDRDRARRHAPARSRQLPAPIRTDGRRHHRAADGRRSGSVAMRRCRSPSGPPIGVRCRSIRFGCSTPDGRQGHASRRAACRRSTLAGLVPAGSRAVAVSLTSADPAAQGFLTADACGQRPDASSANYAPGGARAAFAVVPLRCRRSVVRLLVGGHRPDRRPAGGVRRAGCTRRGGHAVHAAGSRATRRHPRHRSGCRCSRWRRRPDRAVWRSTSPPPVQRRQGYLTAFPCGGTVPVVSNVNFLAGRDDRRVGLRAGRRRRTGVRVLERAGRRDRRSHRHVRRPAARSPTRRPRRLGCSTPATRSADGRPCTGIGQTTDMRAAPDTAVAVTGTVTMVGPARLPASPPCSAVGPCRRPRT